MRRKVEKTEKREVCKRRWVLGKIRGLSRCFLHILMTGMRDCRMEGRQEWSIEEAGKWEGAKEVSGKREGREGRG